MWEKDMEIKDIKDQLNDLVTLLQRSEAQRKELLNGQKMREQAVAIALATSASVRISAQQFSFHNYLTWYMLSSNFKITYK